VESGTLDIADLKLDGLNPRHDPAKHQREIISAILSEAGNKIVRLAGHIAAHGLSPIELPLVVKDSSSGYIVVEGNRRVAALKLLANPNLTKELRYQNKFRALSRKMNKPISEIPCVIAANRLEARPWQEVRHTGERQGVGVVRWDAEATARFYGRRGTQSDRAIILIDAVRQAYPDNDELLRNIDIVRKNRLTTLGRLVSDPDFRGRFGIKIVSNSLVSHYPSQALEAAMSKLFADLAGEVTVAAVDSKELRRVYVDGISGQLPASDAFTTEARPLDSDKTPRQPAPKKPQTPRVSPPLPRPLFDGVRLTALGGRTSMVLSELQQLDVERYPNACAAILRVVIELAVTDVYVRNGWTLEKLRGMVLKCLNQIDRTGKDPKYQSVRTGLADGTSVFSVATIHAYLHNPDFHPTATEIRSIAANYSAFLAALDTLV